MARHVLVVASGDTERRSLPHLLAHLIGSHLHSFEIRTAPHGVLTLQLAERITRAAWWEYVGRGRSLDKVVVLVDADAQTPEQKLTEFDGLGRRLAELPLSVKVAVAKWHLEAWFFADAIGLRAWLGGRSPGAIEPAPDAIPSPKQRLRNLLAETYTSRIAENIAATLSAAAIRETSPSFAAFEAAVKNGGLASRGGPGE